MIQGVECQWVFVSTSTTSVTSAAIHPHVPVSDPLGVSRSWIVVESVGTGRGMDIRPQQP